MKNTEQKPDWEKEYHDKFYPIFNGLAAADGPEYYDYYDKIFNFIRNLLAQKEEQHKAELQSQEAKRASSIAYIIDNDKKLIEKLKQQHRADLKGLKKFMSDREFINGGCYCDIGPTLVKKITNLLDKGEGK